jgi:uncharacterized protein (TIGR03083 family)
MTTDHIDIAGMLDRIDIAWRDFHASYAGLSDDELMIPGVTEGWSVRDLLAHVAVWDGEALRFLPGIVAEGRGAGYDTYEGGIDAFNRRASEEHRDQSLAGIRQELAERHEQLLAYLRSLSDAQISGNMPFRERLAADTWDHYPDHAAAIRAWRERRSQGA